VFKYSQDMGKRRGDWNYCSTQS